MRIGVIGIAGAESSEKMADAIEAATGFRLLIEMNKVNLNLQNGSCQYNGHNLATLDAIVIKKIGTPYSPDLYNRLEILHFLEKKGVRIISSPASIMRLLSRLSCTVELQLAGIPMPPTVVTESFEEAQKAISSFGSAILKPLYTSKAQGMELVSAQDDVATILQNYQKDNSIFYIQKTLNLNEGLDLGVVFVGKEYLTTYARQKGENEWNTSTANGGRYVEYKPDAAILDLAEKARAVFDLAFTCVDVAVADSGVYVFEVSAFGGFKGIESTSSHKPATLLTQHILQILKQK